MDVTFRSIGDWPRAEETHPRRRSPYTVGWQNTLDLLKRELRHLGAEHVVIAADIKEGRIRADGWPRSDARFFGPRVIVSFQHAKTDRWLRYPCDTFNDWEGNLRAIGLTLKDLRTAGGRGVLIEDEQYAGSSLELESGGAEPEIISTREQAARFLSEHGGIVVTPEGVSPSAVGRAYRRAAAKLHPDAAGDSGQFERLQEARDMLMGGR